MLELRCSEWPAASQQIPNLRTFRIACHSPFIAAGGVEPRAFCGGGESNPLEPTRAPPRRPQNTAAVSAPGAATTPSSFHRDPPDLNRRGGPSYLGRYDRAGRVPQPAPRICVCGHQLLPDSPQALPDALTPPHDRSVVTSPTPAPEGRQATRPCRRLWNPQASVACRFRRSHSRRVASRKRGRRLFALVE